MADTVAVAVADIATAGEAIDSDLVAHSGTAPVEVLDTLIAVASLAVLAASGCIAVGVVMGCTAASFEVGELAGAVVAGRRHCMEPGEEASDLAEQSLALR